MIYPSPQITTLSNGLRVATDTVITASSVHLALFVGVGSRYEEAQHEGLSHLLEHMFFKGTTTRDVKTLNRTIEQKGGSLGAFTSRENTSFYARVLPEDVPLALELIADMILNSLFDENELEREKNVIEQEIGEAFDAPDDHIYDILHEVAWPNQPLGRPILGREKTLRAIQRYDLRHYIATHYLAARCVLVAAGAVEHDTFVKEVEKRFSQLPEGQVAVADKAQYKGGSVIVYRPHQEQLHMCYALQIEGVTSPNFYLQGIIAGVLGGGSSSRLFHEIREERGLAYSVSAFSSSYIDTGLLTLYAACEPSKSIECEKVMLDQLLNLGSTINEEELARAKAMIRANLLMELENVESRAERMAFQLLSLDTYRPVETALLALEKISTKDISRFMEKIIVTPLVRACVGPIEELPSLPKSSTETVNES